MFGFVGGPASLDAGVGVGGGAFGAWTTRRERGAVSGLFRDRRATRLPRISGRLFGYIPRVLTLLSGLLETCGFVYGGRDDPMASQDAVGLGRRGRGNRGQGGVPYASAARGSTR